MKKSDNEKLDKFIAKGRWHCILVQGVLFWGISTAILFSIFWHLFGLSSFKTVILPSLIKFPIGGFFFGLFLWYFLKRQFEKNKKIE